MDKTSELRSSWEESSLEGKDGGEKGVTKWKIVQRRLESRLVATLCNEHTPHSSIGQEQIFNYFNLRTSMQKSLLLSSSSSSCQRMGACNGASLALDYHSQWISRSLALFC